MLMGTDFSPQDKQFRKMKTEQHLRLDILEIWSREFDLGWVFCSEQDDA